LIKKLKTGEEWFAVILLIGAMVVIWVGVIWPLPRWLLQPLVAMLD
jgi:hypothetical protein